MPHLWAMCLTYNLRQAMKKLLSILVAATCMAGLTTPVQAEQTPDGLIAVGHFEKLEGCLIAMTDVLASVKNKESADATAPKLIEAASKLKEQMNAMVDLQNTLKQEPNEDDNKAFEEWHTRLHVAGFALQQELTRLAMVEFYGSEAFISALMSLQSVSN